MNIGQEELLIIMKNWLIWNVTPNLLNMPGNRKKLS